MGGLMYMLMVGVFAAAASWWTGLKQAWTKAAWMLSTPAISTAATRACGV